MLAKGLRVLPGGLGNCCVSLAGSTGPLPRRRNPAAQQVSTEQIVKPYADDAHGADNGALLPLALSR